MADPLDLNVAWASGPQSIVFPSHIEQHDYIATNLLSHAHNVLDYGAVGNGTTDDTTAVQDAIDAVNAAGGGTVFFPAGTFICSTLTWYTGVFGVGVGITASIVKLAAGTDDDLIKGENFASLTGGDTVAGIHNWGFRDIALDGNKANNASTSYVLRYYGYRPNLADVDIRNGNDGGMYSQGFTATDPVSTLSVHGDCTRVSFHDNGGYGVVYNGPHDASFTDCYFYYNGDGGCDVQSRAFGTKFVNCHFYGNDHDYCVKVATEGVKFTGCIFEGPQVAGVYLAANTVQINGCYFYAAGTQTAKVGVEIDGAEGYLITGNTFIGQVDGSVVATDDGGTGLISANYVYQESGTAFSGTFDSNSLVHNNQVIGGANGGPGTTVTIASGVATMYPNASMIFLAGEGAAADVLATLSPMIRLGEKVHIIANHEITFDHAAGGTGQILCPGATDYVLAQYGAVCLISSDPNWILVEG